ncbi:hypothetical protein KC340_g98 [Hortaea werneckii]|nr:hypothetical protein KC340_g98 [Hortaea werneckii]
MSHQCRILSLVLLSLALAGEMHYKVWPRRKTRSLPGLRPCASARLSRPNSERGRVPGRADAEKWFKGAENRSQAVDANNTAHEGLAEAQREHADAPQGASTIAENNIGLTAPFNQRVVDQQASMAGIYPTPEDNLMPGHTNQQLSSDNNALATIPEQKDQPDAGESNVAGDAGDQARLSSSSSDPMAFAQNNDDLFGDMGGMELGGDEVDDADFDFFNEQDEMPAVPDMSVIGADAGMSELRPDDDDLAVGDADIVPALHEPANAAKTPDKEDSDQVLPAAPDAGINLDHSAQPDDDDETPAPNSAFKRPLSPFRIKERLLPPPVPASAHLKSDQEGDHRRSSFGPILFRDGLDLGRNLLLTSVCRASGWAWLLMKMPWTT